jgi:hypothetical protein
VLPCDIYWYSEVSDSLSSTVGDASKIGKNADCMRFVLVIVGEL